MASPSSITTQSQGGQDTSVTTTLKAGSSVSTETSPAYDQSTLQKKRPDFTISFVLKPVSPPKGTPVP